MKVYCLTQNNWNRSPGAYFFGELFFSGLFFIWKKKLGEMKWIDGWYANFFIMFNIQGKCLIISILKLIHEMANLVCSKSLNSCYQCCKVNLNTAALKTKALYFHLIPLTFCCTINLLLHIDDSLTAAK